MDAIKNSYLLHCGIFYLQNLRCSLEKSLKYHGKYISQWEL